MSKDLLIDEIIETIRFSVPEPDVVQVEMRSFEAVEDDDTGEITRDEEQNRCIMILDMKKARELFNWLGVVLHGGNRT